MNDLMLMAQQAYDKDGMPGAAKVLLEAALGDVTEEELQESAMGDKYDHDECVIAAFANRKARILAPKTIEERVTVVPTNIDNYSNVLLDGQSVGPGSMRNDYAQTFAKGLIAEMIAENEVKRDVHQSGNIQLAGIGELRASVNFRKTAEREDYVLSLRHWVQTTRHTLLRSPTMEANEEYVRSKWKDTICDGLWLYESTRSYHLRLGDWKHNGNVKDKDTVWQAAYDFTIAREKQMRLVEEEIAWIESESGLSEGFTCPEGSRIPLATFSKQPWMNSGRGWARGKCTCAVIDCPDQSTDGPDKDTSVPTAHSTA